MASAAKNHRGVVLMLCAMAGYALNDTLVKLATHHLSSGQILVVRGGFATFFLLAVACAAGDVSRSRCRSLRQPAVATRCAWEVSAAITSVLALSLAPQATVTAITMAAPVLIGLATIALGWERPDIRRILAALVGLGGVLLVLRPSIAAQSSGGWGLVFALLCAGSLAGRDLATRSIPSDVPTSMIAIAATLATCLVGGMMCFSQGWTPLRDVETVWLGLAAVCAALANLALVAACRDVALSIVAPFRFSIVIWATLLGYLFWDEKPDLPSTLGIMGICAGGLLLMRFNKERAPNAEQQP